MPSRDREILTRFYLGRQSVEQICRDLLATAADVEIVTDTATAQIGKQGKGDTAQALQENEQRLLLALTAAQTWHVSAAGSSELPGPSS
jgi:hypothetical protein